MLTQPLCSLTGTHPEASYPLTCGFLFAGLSSSCPLSSWATALGSDKWVSCRCGYLNQIPWYAFPLLISLHFLELTVVCLFSLGLPTSLGTQPRYPSVAPLLCFIGPEMGLYILGPAYTAPWSNGPKCQGLWSNFTLLSTSKFSRTCVLSHVLILEACIIPCCLSWKSHYIVQLLNFEWTLSPEWAAWPPGARACDLPSSSCKPRPKKAHVIQAGCRVSGADLNRGRGVGREIFSGPNPPRIALLTNSDMDLVF